MNWWCVVGIYAVGALAYGSTVFKAFSAAEINELNTMWVAMAIVSISLLWPVWVAELVCAVLLPWPARIVNWLADRAASNEPKP